MFLRMSIGTNQTACSSLWQVLVFTFYCSIRRSSGGLLLEERATDLCSVAAKVRYQGFIDKYQAISQTLVCWPHPWPHLLALLHRCTS